MNNVAEDYKKLEELLSDKMWRLTSGKLYNIKDKGGNKIPFIPNKAQLYYLRHRHNRNIILKARQLGFSTLIEIMILDKFLFSSYKTMGIIADRQGNANDLFTNKIKFAFDNLPEWLRREFKIAVDRVGEMKSEKNETSVSVDTSFRGGTLQKLHVSEFGKIASKYPEKAREIVTGALNTIAVDAEVDIESTAEGASGLFHEMTMKAMEKKGELSPLDYKFFFFPRFEDESYTMEVNEDITEETEKYFSELRNKEYIVETYGDIEFTNGQKLWYQKKKQEQRDDMFREFPSTPEEAFNVSVEGAYYEKEIALARRQGRIGKVEYDPRLPVYTAWDLGGAGGGDNTSIRFFQIFGLEIRLIDYWEGNGMSMIEIISDVIYVRDYNYRKHFLPRDAEITEYSSGMTRKETAIKHLREGVNIVPKMSISDGINAVRNILANSYFNEALCNIGVKRLQHYKRKWIASTGSFADSPQHDENSHGADAFRYLSIIVNRIRSVGKSQTVVQNYSADL